MSKHFRSVRRHGGRTVSGGENDCLVSVQDGPTLHMIPDGTGQNTAFNIPAFADQIVRIVCVRNPFHVLLDDRAFIEIACHIMGCGPDQFDPSAERLMVGTGPLKPGRNE